MNLALNEAWKYQILTYPNPAVGCVVLDKFGKILSIEAHKESGKAHAEVCAILSALKKINQKFKDKTFQNPVEAYEFILKNHDNSLENSEIYVTLEPCNHYGKTPPCAKLIKELKFKRVIIGTQDPNLIAGGGADFLKKSGIEVKIGVLQNLAKELIEPFIEWSKGNFTFFKIALSQNGVATGGIISSLESRTLVHKMRSKLDLLVIGGNTVRIDRPTLDARLVNKKAPNVMIYSKYKNFDKNIPLFNIKNREVEISKDLNKIKTKSLVMIEGGENFMKNLPDFVKYFLIFSSNSFFDNKNLQANLSLKLIHSYNLSSDKVLFLKRLD